MEWIRTHVDRLLIGSAAGCIVLALAVLGYAALANSPGAAFTVTIFTGTAFFATWAVWFMMRRSARSRRNASRLDHAR